MEGSPTTSTTTTACALTETGSVELPKSAATAAVAGGAKTSLTAAWAEARAPGIPPTGPSVTMMLLVTGSIRAQDAICGPGVGGAE